MTLKSLADLPAPTKEERREAVIAEHIDRQFRQLDRAIVSGQLTSTIAFERAIGYDRIAAKMRADYRYTAIRAMVEATT